MDAPQKIIGTLKNQIDLYIKRKYSISSFDAHSPQTYLLL